MRKFSGFRAWLVQRLTAIYLAIYIVAAVAFFVLTDIQNYSQWVDFIRHPVITVSLLLFGFFLLLHVWIGVRDIFIDYLHPFWLRMTALALLMLSLFIAGFWMLTILTPLTGVGL